MCVVGAKEKKYYRNTQKEFLRWCVLISIVDLFPHVQIIVGPSIEFERHASNIVKHKVRAKHVGDIR